MNVETCFCESCDLVWQTKIPEGEEAYGGMFLISDVHQKQAQECHAKYGLSATRVICFDLEEVKDSNDFLPLKRLRMRLAGKELEGRASSEEQETLTSIDSMFLRLGIV